MSWWQKLLGIIRRLLNKANEAGLIPSQNPTIPVDKNAPHK